MTGNPKVWGYSCTCLYFTLFIYFFNLDIFFQCKLYYRWKILIKKFKKVIFFVFLLIGRLPFWFDRNQIHKFVWNLMTRWSNMIWKWSKGHLVFHWIENIWLFLQRSSHDQLIWFVRTQQIICTKFKCQVKNSSAFTNTFQDFCVLFHSAAPCLAVSKESLEGCSCHWLKVSVRSIDANCCLTNQTTKLHREAPFWHIFV